MFTIFAEYSAWAAFGETSRSTLAICLFLLCKWGIQYAHLVMTDTWVISLTNNIPSFLTVAQTELWMVAFLIGQSEHICKLNMHIQWRQTWWVILVPTTIHIPSFITVAHTKFWIFAFLVISQSEQICKWGIKYAYLVMIDHVGSTCVHHYPHNMFHQCSPYRTLDIWLFVINQSEQICKWGIKYVHLVMTDHVGNTYAPHYQHAKF